jgi:DNA-binding NtrC family response regulator
MTMLAKILLVDDEVPFVEALARRLSKRELTVLTAFGGQEALEKLAQDKGIDIVVLDVKMPGMDGIECLQQIKVKFPLVEVIMLTGHATVENAIDGMKQGALDYLMKPCDIDILLAKVQDGASRKRKQEQKIAEARAQHIALRRGD